MIAFGTCQRCKAYGHVVHQATASDLASIMELMACEIQAEVSPDSEDRW